MKLYIDDLEPITGPDPSGNVIEFSFCDMLQYFVDTSNVFNRGGQAIRAGGRIDAELVEVAKAKKAKKPKKFLSIKTDDLKFLQICAENPSEGGPQLVRPYPVMPARRLQKFLDRIEKAEEVEAEREKDTNGASDALDQTS